MSGQTGERSVWSPMSHTTSTRRPRAGMGPTHRRYVAPPLPFSTPVSLGNTMNPLRMTLKTSAPSRPPFPRQRLAPDARGPAPNRAPTFTADACRLLPQMISLGRPSHRASVFAADARVPSPRMITHGSHPKRACPTTVDARVLSRMISRSALIGVEADACGYTSQMISRSAFTGVEADACANPQMISRSAFTGVEADACANPQMISHAPFRAAEGALTTLILTLSPSPFRHSRPLPRGACPPKADHSGLRAGIHPLTSSLSSSRDDRPVALGVGAPNGAPTPLSPYTKGPAC